MSVTYRNEGSILVFTLEGANTREEAEQAFREAFLREEETGTTPNVLIDAGTSERHRPVNEVASLAESLGRFRPRMGRRCALYLSPGRPEQPRLERYLAGFSGLFQIEFFMFHRREDALAWLNEQPSPDRDKPLP